MSQVARFSASPLPRWVAVILTASFTLPAAAAPQVFWASDPIRPDETVLLQGCDFAGAVVEVVRLDDATPSGPANDWPWAVVPVLQASDCSLKFALPADWSLSVFACRVKTGQAVSEATLLNVPDPWWLQGDEGQQATPGGWLRVLGKSLHFGRPARIRLEPQTGEPVILEATQRTATRSAWRCRST